MAIKPTDEYFHDRSEWPGGFDESAPVWWNESGYFHFAVPERDLTGWVYVHHRVNHGFLYAGVCVWDTTGDTESNCLWNDFNIHPLPANSNVWDFSLDIGLTSRCVDPLKHYEFTYRSGGVELDLTWKATMEPVDMLVPDEWKEYCPRHFDGIGRATGEIVIDGERLEIDTISARDRSWGPHTMRRTGRGTWVWGALSEDHAWIGHIVSDLAQDEDPLFGTTERVRGGWLLRDGVLGRFVDGERQVERAEDTRPLKESIVGRDEHGREMTAMGTTSNHLLFTGFRDFPWWWCMMRWNIDGQDGGHGETMDAAVTPLLRRAMRSRLEPAAAGSR